MNVCNWAGSFDMSIIWLHSKGTRNAITIADRRLVYHARAIAELLTVANDALMTSEWTAVVHEDSNPNMIPIL